MSSAAFSCLRASIISLKLLEYDLEIFTEICHFHCLLSPDGNDPIFIGINRLVAKGLTIDEQETGADSIQYPCGDTKNVMK